MCEFEAFVAHLLDQHAELQFAAAGHLERLGLVRVGHFDCDVAFGLAEQTFANLARGDFLALAAGQGTVIDAGRHRQGRRIDGDGGQWRRQIRGADRVRDGGVGQTGDRDDISGFRFVDRDSLQTPKRQQFGQAAGFNRRAIAAQHLHLQAC